MALPIRYTVTAPKRRSAALTRRRFNGAAAYPGGVLRRLLPLASLLLAACAEIGDVVPAITPAQRARAEQRNEQALAEEQAKRAAMDKIVVLPGDSSRPYRVLGPVKPDLHLEGCTPDKLREAALAQYGKVDAIIGYMQTGSGVLPSTVDCEGTAVVFTNP